LRSFKFTKYHGTGNDFIIIDDCSESFAPGYIQLLCHRRYGIGADGLILISESSIADVKMRIFNSDGKEASMCGNGLRSVVDHIGRDISIETLMGVYKGEYIPGCPRVLMHSFPDKKYSLELPIFEETHALDIIDSGVPHAIMMHDDIHSVNLKRLGSSIRHADVFKPHGVNVNFIQFVSPTSVKMRTYERGVEDETFSCGTGATAVAQLIDKPKLEVIFSSNERLFFEKNSDSSFWMSGKCQRVFEGYTPSLL